MGPFFFTGLAFRLMATRFIKLCKRFTGRSPPSCSPDPKHVLSSPLPKAASISKFLHVLSDLRLYREICFRYICKTQMIAYYLYFSASCFFQMMTNLSICSIGNNCSMSQEYRELPFMLCTAQHCRGAAPSFSC